jgi:GntP family gluconate:H+ symporter
MSLLIMLIIVVVLMVIATTRYHFHPFLSLLLIAIIMGFWGGLNETEVSNTIVNGFGKTLGSIGIIIAFGTVIGAYLEKSGGARALARQVIKITGEKRSALAMNLTGFIVSIPVFCDSGFVILSSLNKALSRSARIPLVMLGVSLAAGLYATHVFVPPTPGPLAAAAALQADLGLVILLGLVLAVPVSLAGFFWAKYIGSKLGKESGDVIVENKVERLPAGSTSLAPILVPIVLIALKSISNYPSQPFGDGLIASVFNFIGNPVIALFAGVFLAFRLKDKTAKETHFNWVAGGLKEAGIIILITGAGGAFGAILRATGIGDIIGAGFSDLQIGILLPFVIAAILKSAQGSSTVSIITTAAIMAPLLAPFGLDSALGRALTVMSIGAGAMTVSHLNDSYFWVVAQFTEMDTATALKSQTMSTLFQGLTGISIIVIISVLFL